MPEGKQAAVFVAEEFIETLRRAADEPSLPPHMGSQLRVIAEFLAGHYKAAASGGTVTHPGVTHAQNFFAEEGVELC